MRASAVRDVQAVLVSGGRDGVFDFFQRWRVIEIEAQLAIRTDGRDLLYVPGITVVPRRQNKSVKIFSRLRL